MEGYDDLSEGLLSIILRSHQAGHEHYKKLGLQTIHKALNLIMESFH